MRIAFLTYSMTGGGAERVISVLANRFCAEDDVTIMQLSDLEPEYVLDERISLMRLHVARESRNAWESVGNFRNTIRALRKATKEFQPDVIVSFAMRHAVTAKIALGSRCRVVGSERSNPYLAVRSRGEQIICRISPVLDGCVFQTKGASGFYPSSLRRKSTVIPNGVSFGSRPQQDAYAAREKQIIVTGRLVRLKRHDLILQAFAAFLQKYPDYRMLILGEGGEREKILSQLRENGLEPHVTLMGFQKNVADFLTRSRMFVLASEYEGMPNGLIEAMACGCACISTDCDFGPSELIEDGENGLLVRGGDADAIYQAMCRIAEDDALGTRLSENAQKINETHSMDTIAGRYRDYLLEVTGGARNP